MDAFSSQANTASSLHPAAVNSEKKLKMCPVASVPESSSGSSTAAASPAFGKSHSVLSHTE